MILYLQECWEFSGKYLLYQIILYDTKDWCKVEISDKNESVGIEFPTFGLGIPQCHCKNANDKQV